MAPVANPQNLQAENVALIGARAHAARQETKRLARQLRTTVRALAELEAACGAHGIKLVVETAQAEEPQHHD